MAKESFDTELQFLRMMLLTTGAYSRTQFAERLGISVHTFDKTLKRMKDMLYFVSDEARDEDRKDIYSAFRYSYIENPDYLFTFLFRTKSMKQTEVQRLSFILTSLAETELTLKDMMERFYDRTEADDLFPDEKTLRQDFKYLEELAVVKKTNKARPYTYTANTDLLHSLTQEELIQLYDFVDVMAHTQIPSVQGYMLRATLKRMLMQEMDEDQVQGYSYQYHYVTRILDEYNLFAILEAYNKRRTIRFVYYSPKRKQVFSSKNTNPRFEKELIGAEQHVIPLKVVYDHQYGRWYLMAKGINSSKLIKYRLEGITQLEEDIPFDAEQLRYHQQQVDEQLRHSWLIDTGRAVTIRLKFYYPMDTPNNFILRRVQLQGQWGVVVEEQEDSFIFEIKVNSMIEIKPWVRSFGSSCEVLEPRYFREEMRKEWEVIHRYYESI